MADDDGALGSELNSDKVWVEAGIGEGAATELARMGAGTRAGTGGGAGSAAGGGGGGAAKALCDLRSISSERVSVKRADTDADADAIGAAKA